MAKASGKKQATFDRRLLGTWKSHRRMTLLHLRPRPDATPRGIRKLKSLFGKLVIRWRRGKYDIELDGERWTESYEVVARDSEGVVVRTNDELFGERLNHIRFEGDYYWLALAPGLCEFFKRVSN